MILACTPPSLPPNKAAISATIAAAFDESITNFESFALDSVLVCKSTTVDALGADKSALGALAFTGVALTLVETELVFATLVFNHISLPLLLLYKIK